MLKLIADSGREYCGLPTMIEGERLVLEPRHPAAGIYGEIEQKTLPLDEDPEVLKFNSWYSHKERCEILMWTNQDGSVEWGRLPAMHHFDHSTRTMGCSFAWSMDAEIKALETLGELVPPHIFKMYFTSGMFLETSKRSGVIYFFRKLKPTVAVRADPKTGKLKILACLCLHPLGYYAETWAGAMCPTDDVLAHLLMMRADEVLFWRRANQIAAHKPNAGL